MSKGICSEFFDHVRSIVKSSRYKDAEIHLTEWNTSPSPRDLIHDTEFPASFILYNVLNNFGKIDSLGFWTFTDIFEENGPGRYPFHGGFGLLNDSGIPKPAYYAYQFLAELGDEIVSVNDHQIVTKTGDNYTAILWNYCYYKDEFAQGDRSKLTLTDRDRVFEHENINVSLYLELTGSYSLEVKRLNKETSAFHNWVKQGAPQYPSLVQIEELKEKSVPKCESYKFKDAFISNFNLDPFEVILLKFKKM